ncbi:MAG: CRISPR-associated protein Cas4 [Anaerolinea sp.]|nr:CRISPR-associated protein Cas4 [Anaerolinea sp.]
MIWYILALIGAAVLLFFLSLRLRKQIGLPGGKIIYSDVKMWGQPLEKPLFDGSIGLVGKPDYLIRQKGEVIPVEVKSCRAPNAPYDSHIFQLAAYCLLVEKVYQVQPTHGLIHYPGRTFSIEFTPQLREQTLTLISGMHRLERSTNIPRSHQESARCNSCGYKNHCDQRL